MLIEKQQYTSNDVVSIRLTTGEEILAKIVEETAFSITISKPVLVQIQMISEKQAGIGFAPLMVTVDEGAQLTIPMSSILIRPVKSRSDISAQYIKMTTGLDVPMSGLIR